MLHFRSFIIFGGESIFSKGWTIEYWGEFIFLKSWIMECWQHLKMSTRMLSQSLHSIGGMGNTFADAVFVLLLFFGVEFIFLKNCWIIEYSHNIEGCQYLIVCFFWEYVFSKKLNLMFSWCQYSMVRIF